MKSFEKYVPTKQFIPRSDKSVVAWGLEFRSPIMNSAGMFKNGDGYDVVQTLGAGGYIGGTSTANSRLGNAKNSIKLPFITLPDSNVAINWLGLPNLGDDVLAHKNITFNKVKNCPIGWSVMRSPDYDETIGLNLLIESLWKYHDHPQVDFIEINESCPNIKSGGGNIVNRLQIIAAEFLHKRKRKLPIIIKLSNDITTAALEEILEELLKLGYDGINLGNTSVNYELIQKSIKNSEVRLFKFFAENYGGGVSGALLKSSSLLLCQTAVKIVKRINPNYEFHVIRSGGVESSDDIAESLRSGVTLVQWYTGFFTAFHLYGENVYQNLLDK